MKDGARVFSEELEQQHAVWSNSNSIQCQEQYTVGSNSIRHRAWLSTSRVLARFQ